MKWKKKKMEERGANLAKLRADRAKNDRMSGRELFMSDSSWFVDDVEAYDKYEREEESDEPKMDQDSSRGQPSTLTTSQDIHDGKDIPDNDEVQDDDDLDVDKLYELAASLSKTSLQTNKPAGHA